MNDFTDESKHFFFTGVGDLYHTIIDMTWWKVLMGVSIIWFFTHLIFACLYFIGIDKDFHNTHIPTSRSIIYSLIY